MAVEGVKIVLTIDDSQMNVTAQRAGQVLRTLQNNIEATAASTKNIETHFTGVTGKFRDLIIAGGMLRFVIYDIRDSFNATIGKVIQSSAEIERMTKLMEGLSKETTNQAKALDAIQGREFVFNLAKNAPFQVTALTDSFVKLKTAGLDPTQGSLQTLVDSVARFGGSSEHLKRASVAIQQMVGKGVISMEELRQQLGEAIPDAMQAMAIGTGLSMAELAKNIANGEVEATSAIERMMTVMRYTNEGSAAAMMETWNGQLEKMKTNFTLFSNDIGQNGFFQTMKDSLEDLNDYFETNEAKRFAASIGDDLNQVAKWTVGAIKGIAEYGSEIKTLGQILLTLWAGNVLRNGINGVQRSISAFNTTYIGGLRGMFAQETILQNSRIANERALVIEQTKTANAGLIAAEKAAAAELAVNRAKHAELLVQENTYRAQYEAANRVATTGRLANGRIVSNAVKADNAAIATSYFQMAMAAERSINQIKAAEAGLVAQSSAAAAAMAANRAAAAEQLAILGTTASRTSIAIGVLGKTMGLLGGPIGVITTALSLGLTAWFMWGNAADEAGRKAKDAIDRVRQGVANLEDMQAIQRGIAADQARLAELETKIERARNTRGAAAPAAKTAMEKWEAEQKELREKVAKSGEQLASAYKQAQQRSIDEYVSGSQRNVDLMMREYERQTLSSEAMKIKEIKESTDDEKDKQTRIATIIREGITARANDRIAALSRQSDLVIAQLRKNTDKEGKALTAEGVKSRQALIAENARAIQEQERIAQEGQKVGTKYTVMSMKGDGKNTGPLRSPFETLLDDLKAKNVELDSEIEGFQSKTAKLRWELDNTEKYWQKTKNGVIKPTEAQKDEVVALSSKVESKGLINTERDRRINEGRQAILGMRRLATESQASLDSVFQTMLDGNTKFEAAGVLTLKENLAKFKESLELAASIEDGRGAQARSALEGWTDFFNKQVNSANAVEAAKSIDTYRQATERLKASNIQDDRTRRDAQFKAETALQIQQAQYRLSQLVGIDEQTVAIRKNLIEEFNNWQVQRTQEHVIAMRTPLQELAFEWENITKQMQDASVRWANSSIDKMLEFVKTGKMNFTDLADSILSDIARIGLQRTMGGAINSVMDGIAGFATQMFGGKPAVQASEDPAKLASAALATELTNAKDQLATMSNGVAEAAAGLVTSTTKNAAAATSTATLSHSATSASVALTNLASAATAAAASVGVGGGGGDSGLGMLASIGASFFGGSAGSSAALAGTTNVSSGINLSGYSPFAKGGIMTDMGPVALRKYANGGIANSPQLAMFGEGSMNEAYVPLPDGRTIPVTMRGSVGGVVVNVIEAPGTKTSVQENQNQDGTMSIDIIVEQIEGKMSQNIGKGRGTLSKTLENTYGLNRTAGNY
ncbi:tape measure protein [Methylobacillus sp.]|uniref:tape measure protein n=1 Tax=Methylobacillus sp. TaxID=56818 RepID=UPI0012D17EA5|nr:tape measure protein [Methylobacillus sp.]MPS48551.1 hypothetical protein [Methylobacillus sp.]